MTTRVEGDAYPNLLREKGGTGFPYLVFMDAEGNVLAKQGERTVAGFQKTLKACGDYLALEKKAKAGDKTVGADLLVAQIQMGQVKYDDAKQKASALGKIDAEKQKTLDGLLLNLEVASIMEGDRTPAAMVEHGKKFKVMLDAGRVPTGPIARSFYTMILAAAEAESDVATYEKVLGSLKQLLGDAPGSARMLERFEQTLAKLKGAGGDK